MVIPSKQLRSSKYTVGQGRETEQAKKWHEGGKLKKKGGERWKRKVVKSKATNLEAQRGEISRRILHQVMHVFGCNLLEEIFHSQSGVRPVPLPERVIQTSNSLHRKKTKAVEQPSSTTLSFSISHASTKQVSLGKERDRRAHRTPLGLAYLLRYQVGYEGDRRFNGGLTDWKLALVRKSGEKVRSTRAGDQKTASLPRPRHHTGTT